MALELIIYDRVGLEENANHLFKKTVLGGKTNLDTLEERKEINYFKP